MANNIGELFVQLGTVGDSKELEKFVAKVKEGVIAIEKQMQLQDKATKQSKKGVTSTISELGALITTLSLVGVAWSKMTDELVRTNQQMLNLTRTSDIALSTFQKFDILGRMFGIQGLAGQIDNLNQRLFELRLTGQGARAFQLAGINPAGLDAEGVIEKLRDRISGMDNTTASYLLQQMGLNPQMLVFLRRDYEDLWRTVKRYQLSEKQRTEIEKLNVQLQVARIKMQYIKDRIILALMPALVRITESLAGIVEMFAKLGNTLTKNGAVKLKGTALGITLLTMKFKGFASILKNMGASLSGIITKIPIVGRLFAGLGKIVGKAFGKLLILWMILDDLAVFFEGGDSLIGRVVDWAKERGSEIGDAFSMMFGGQFWEGLMKLLDTIVSGINDLIKVVDGLIEVARDILSFGLYGSVKEKALDVENHPVLNKVFTSLFPRVPLQEDLINGWNKFVTPGMSQNVTKSNFNNKNMKVSMNNYIYTNETADSLENELAFMQRQYALG